MPLTTDSNTQSQDQLKVTGVFTGKSEAVLNSTELTVCKPEAAQTLGITQVMLSEKSTNRGKVYTIKVHKELLTNICQTRNKSNTYHTNKLLKTASFYYLLKSLTSTGIIKDYVGSVNKICEFINITPPTFNRRVKECEKRGYLTRNAGSLVLASFSTFAATFDTCYTELVSITYLPSEPTPFYKLMQSAYLQVREAERAKVFESKFKAIPELVQELETIIKSDEHGNYQKSLAAAQIAAFKHGHELIHSLFYLNPDTSVNAHTMRQMFGFKSQQSVAYLKSSLKSAGLLRIRERKIYSEKCNKVKHLTMRYDAKNKATYWYMPDRLEHAPILVFKKIEK